MCNPHWLIIFLINKKKVKKELGVAKKSLRETQIVKLEDGKFEKKRKKTSFVFGGSDTCQVVTPVIFTDFIHSHRLKIKFWKGDSGGPLYIFDEKKRRAILGITWKT